MKRALLALALILAACSDSTGPDDRWADPTQIRFAASLNVSLDQMNRTASGLYWQDLTVGSGATARLGQTVIVHYRGWLPDGTLFDSSYPRNQPIEFTVGGGQVIRGMDEGMIGVQVGGIRKLVIPPGLAYGQAGRGPIPPLSTLVFDVELVSIRP